MRQLVDAVISRVATMLTSLLAAGGSARAFALQLPDEQTLAATDITRTKRAVIHFERADVTPIST